MTDLKDKQQEMARLNDEAQRLENEIQRIANKLNNDGFVSRAPAAAIEKEQKKMAAFQRKQTELKQQIAEIETL